MTKTIQFDTKFPIMDQYSIRNIEPLFESLYRIEEFYVIFLEARIIDLHFLPLIVWVYLN